VGGRGGPRLTDTVSPQDAAAAMGPDEVDDGCYNYRKCAPARPVTRQRAGRAYALLCGPCVRWGEAHVRPPRRYGAKGPTQTRYSTRHYFRCVRDGCTAKKVVEVFPPGGGQAPVVELTVRPPSLPRTQR